MEFILLEVFFPLVGHRNLNDLGKNKTNKHKNLKSLWTLLH